MVDLSRVGFPRSAPHGVRSCRLGNVRHRDPWWWLRWQADLELLQQQFLVRFGFGVARQHDHAAVSGRHVHVNHLHRRHLLHHRAGGQTWCQRAQPLLQGDLQAIRDEGDKDVRLDAFLELMEDRPNAKLILEAFERLLDILFVMPLRI